MDKYEALKIAHSYEIKMILNYMNVSDFCRLCGISRVYYYKIIKKMTKYEIYKKYVCC